jgi:3-hydroxybutyryl-CoA dehydrogenase
MGAGIAETAARQGFTTLLYEPKQEVLEKAKANIANGLRSQVDKGRMTEREMKDVLDRLYFTHDLKQCQGDVVIEAIIEDIAAKSELLWQLATLNGTGTILASNTSSLSLTEIARTVPTPERFCGMHFFNPAQLMKLVEVVYTKHTSLETIRAVRELAAAMGKSPVICKDSPGFIVNRVARHYYLEAFRLLEDGICNIEQADRIMENAGFRMGPFRLMDLIGNDINYAVTTSLYKAYGEPVRFRPAHLQGEMVTKGELGRKTGKGYYNY